MFGNKKNVLRMLQKQVIPQMKGTHKDTLVMHSTFQDTTKSTSMCFQM